MRKPSQSSFVQSADLLATLRASQEPLGTVDIAEAVGMDRSNCSKALRRLEESGDIVQLTDGRWMLLSDKDPKNIVAVKDGDRAVSISMPPMIAVAIAAYFKPSGIKVDTIHLEIGVSNEPKAN